VQGGGVDRVVVLPDVLAHLDGGDRVEGVVRAGLGGDRAVVLHADLDLVGQPEGAHAREPVRLLLRGEHDAHGAHPVVVRRVDQQ